MHGRSTKTKAYSYLRFSTADQAKGDSYRRQIALAEDYAKAKSLELDKSLTFQDLGVSAFTGKNRKKGALRAFLDAVEEEIISAGSFLLVESLDRVSREAILDAQATFLQIVNAGITLVTLKGNPREYSRETVNANPTDLLISLLEMIRAREESETKSQRIKADWLKKREKASKGEAITSLIPAWLKRDGKAFEVIPERAEIVRRIYDLTLSGLGQHAITSVLNKEGIKPFGSGKRQRWDRSYVHRILNSSTVIGTFTPHRMIQGRREPMEPIEGYFPAVVSRETYEAVRALDRQDRTAPPREVASIFSGLVKCEQCGGPMVRTRRGTREKGFYYSFSCHNAKIGHSCEYRGVRQDIIENALIENLQEFLHDAPTHDEDLTDELDRVVTAIDVTREQIDGLVEAISRKPLPSLITKLSDLEASLPALTSRKSEIEAALRDTAKPVVMKRLNDLKAALTAEGGPDRPRANVLLRQVLDHVIIRFDPEASYRRPRGYLDFHWKGGGYSALFWGPLFYPVRK
jgi:DNA invertase Pin-like site-specific DNA recombinase